MKTTPVSFGSLMVFTIKDDKPKAPVPALIKTTFDNNPDLFRYNLSDIVKFEEGIIDGSVHNAAPKFCEFLDKKYKNFLRKNPKNVIFTEANFRVNPFDTEKRYFITAASDADEDKIHKTLSKGITIYSAKFGYKA